MLLVLELKVLKKNKKISEQDFKILLHFLQSDASIKKLNGINITKDGYKLTGIMIGFELFEIPIIYATLKYVTVYQHSNMIYAIYGCTMNNVFVSDSYASDANIVYI